MKPRPPLLPATPKGPSSTLPVRAQRPFALGPRTPTATPTAPAAGDNISSPRVPEHLSSRSRNAPAPCLPCSSPSKQLSAPPATAEPTDERRRSLPCSSSLPWLPLPLIHPLSSLYRCSPRHGSHRRPPRRAPPPLDLLSPWSYSSPAQSSQAACELLCRAHPQLLSFSVSLSRDRRDRPRTPTSTPVTTGHPSPCR